MVRGLIVGDPHVRVADLAECRRLRDGITSIAVAEKVNFILVTGDLFHHFALMRQEVVLFWKETFEIWNEAGFRVIAQVGNHDMAGDGTEAIRMNALMTFQEVTVVDRPRIIEGMLMLPYMPDPKEFVKICNEKSQYQTVYCHQEFNGAKYENGFYAKEGVDPDMIPQKTVISGHIHLSQLIGGKVIYVGSPRWLTASDANSDKFLWVIDHDENGAIVSDKRFPTDEYCRRMFEVEDTPEAPFSTDLNPNHEYVINVRGPTAWVESRKALWEGRAKFRTVNTDAQVAKVRESEGIRPAFIKFAKQFSPPNGSDKKILEEMAERRLFASV